MSRSFDDLLNHNYISDKNIILIIVEFIKEIFHELPGPHDVASSPSLIKLNESERQRADPDLTVQTRNENIPTSSSLGPELK